MSTVTIHEAKAHLSALIERSLQGEEVIIARRNKPLVKIVPLEPSQLGERKLGTAKGLIWMADDFDETPEEFAEYMP
ncbi:MAG: type II toxin-antitoxin system prevent-host-death family antitoxin [Spirochaetales bacterium]